MLRRKIPKRVMAKRWLKEGLNFKCDVYTCEQTKRILISERWRRRRKKTRLNFNVVREYLHDTAWNSFGNDRKLQKDHVTRSRVWISDAIEYDNTQIQLMVSAMKGIQRRLYSSNLLELHCTITSTSTGTNNTEIMAMCDEYKFDLLLSLTIWLHIYWTRLYSELAG